MKTRILSILLFASGCFCSHAAPETEFIKVNVAPEHGDWLYKTGENVRFSVSVTRNSVPLENVKVRYEVAEEMMPSRIDGDAVLKDGAMTVDAGTMDSPGFLRCNVYAEYGGKEYSGVATAGFEPEKLQPTVQLPGDFTDFWEKAKAEAAKVDMDVRMELVPGRCTGKTDTYHVSLQSYKDGSRVCGMLCVPKAPGKYPAILKLPAAGVRPYSGDTGTADKGVIVFEIGAHGIPVNMPGTVYEDLRKGALWDYPVFNIDDRDRYYYKRMYLGCLRAVDFIYSLPQFDGERLATFGISQGGALSIMTTALDKRVKAAVAIHPALCDMEGYVHGRAGGWPHVFADKANRTPEKLSTARYYDIANFARFVNVPMFFSFGYNDNVCPATTVYSVYNTVKSPKTVFLAEETAHYIYPEQIAAAHKWIFDFFASHPLGN